MRSTGKERNASEGKLFSRTIRPLSAMRCGTERKHILLQTISLPGACGFSPADVYFRGTEMVKWDTLSPMEERECKRIF
jgi:hypothetical protein